MALINCPECSKEVSDKAPACPNCGVVLNASSTEKVHSVIWGWWMGMLCLLGFVFTGAVMLWGPQLFLVFVLGFTPSESILGIVIGFFIGIPLNCWLWWTIIRRSKKSQR